VKVGDLVTLKVEWQTIDVYYGIGVITLLDEDPGMDGHGRWKSFRVQWNDDFSWHDPSELDLVSESWRPNKTD